jgi:hypothetical protein
MAVDAVKSQSITNLDATPIVPNTAGQGATGRRVEVDDFVTTTATGLQSAGSSYRIVRIPTGAVIKSVTIATDKSADVTASTAVLALDVNLAFSDSTKDGTPANLQGLIPTTANTGGTTTLASYSSPNKIFGTVKAVVTPAVIGPTEYVFNGIGTTYNFLGLTQQPLWQTFGFTDGRGSPADPGGYFDLLVYVLTAATTGQACNLYARVAYEI